MVWEFPEDTAINGTGHITTIDDKEGEKPRSPKKELPGGFGFQAPPIKKQSNRQKRKKRKKSDDNS